MVKHPTGKYLVRQYKTYYAVVQIPASLQHIFGKKKFSQTLNTHDFEDAEYAKIPWVKHWKDLIKKAKKSGTVSEFDVEAGKKEASEIINKLQSSDPDLAAISGAQALRPPTDQDDLTNPDTRAAVKAFGEITKGYTPTNKFVTEWLDHHNYQPDVRDETERFLLNNFCVRFPYFETISITDLKTYLDDLRGGRTELNQNRCWTISTLGKNFSRVKLYWTWCYERHTQAPNLAIQPGVMPTQSRTKANQKATSNSSFKPFSRLEVIRLLETASRIAEENGTKLSQNLEDAIRIGMYTGMRIGEIADMKTEDVGKDRFTVVDSKTYNGLRDIPIHPDIQQLVERLIQTSEDGYLISGESTDNKYNKRSPGLSKRFGRLKKNLGFENKRHAFHSLRATLAARFESAGVLENFAARIIGHQVDTMTYGLYSGEIDWDKAVEAMSKVDYYEQ